MSAGSQPASEINPAVIQAMAETGLDLSREFPKPLTSDQVQAADIIITMGCGDACPVYPGKRYLDWDLPDPAGLPLEQVRPIRDDIQRRVRQLITELNLSAGPNPNRHCGERMNTRTGQAAHRSGGKPPGSWASGLERYLLRWGRRRARSGSLRRSLAVAAWCQCG